MRLATNNGMKLITREELKGKLDRGDDFRLVMVYEPWAFNMKHIPGSINMPATRMLVSNLGPLGLDDEIVVYCSGEECGASRLAYATLKALGYRNVRRYAGGIADWESAGYALEGEVASPASAAQGAPVAPTASAD